MAIMPGNQPRELSKEETNAILKQYAHSVTTWGQIGWPNRALDPSNIDPRMITFNGERFMAFIKAIRSIE
jgi:hypothetical protein